MESRSFFFSWLTRLFEVYPLFDCWETRPDLTTYTTSPPGDEELNMNPTNNGPVQWPQTDADAIGITLPETNIAHENPQVS